MLWIAGQAMACLNPTPLLTQHPFALCQVLFPFWFFATQELGVKLFLAIGFHPVRSLLPQSDTPLILMLGRWSDHGYKAPIARS